MSREPGRGSAIVSVERDAELGGENAGERLRGAGRAPRAARRREVVRARDRARQPELAMGRGLVEDVLPPVGELDRQDPLAELDVGVLERLLEALGEARERGAGEGLEFAVVHGAEGGVRRRAGLARGPPRRKPRAAENPGKSRR